MSNPRNESGGEKMLAGDCPECGVVTTDSVLLNFPLPAKCADCGSELETAGYADKKRVEAML